jgi:ATP-binding protein involved in chromosome partitioning
MTTTTTADVLAALAVVIDPTFHKPMVELGLLRDVVVEGTQLTCTVSLSSGSDTIKQQIQQEIAKAIAPFSIQNVAIDWELKVPTRQSGADDPIPGVRNVVLVMSGKGGVGKSTCAVNLALALSRSGARVGILDADIYGPSRPTMLGVSGHPRSLDGVKIQPMERFGVKLMSIGFLSEDPKAAIIWRGPMLQGALLQFLKDVEWGELDYLVFDLPPGTGDVTLTLAQKIRTTGAVIVTTPQEVALQDVYKSVSMAQKLNIPILGVIENMSYFIDPAGLKHEIFGSGGGQKIAEFAKAPLLGQIPLEPAVRQWGDDGTPIVQAQPRSIVAEAFAKIAEELGSVIAKRHFDAAGGAKAPAVDPHRRLKILR